MKRSLSLILAAITVICCFSLVGCSKYTSSYSAVLFVHSNSSHDASMSFYIFNGTKVYTLKTEKGSEATLKYSGKLDDGSAIIYYDYDGTKKELFSISAGDEIESSVSVPENTTVHIIFETIEKCENGAFSFEIE